MWIFINISHEENKAKLIRYVLQFSHYLVISNAAFAHLSSVRSLVKITGDISLWTAFCSLDLFSRTYLYVLICSQILKKFSFKFSFSHSLLRNTRSLQGPSDLMLPFPLQPPLLFWTPLAGLHKAQDERSHLAADPGLTASHQPQKKMETNPTSLSRLCIYPLVQQNLQSVPGLWRFDTFTKL